MMPIDEIRMKYTDVINTVPEGQVGIAQVIHETPNPLQRLCASLHGMPLFRDRYARLLLNGDVVMTDAEFERLSNYQLLARAHGDCLVFGLGLGLILHPLLKLCSTVTVVEKEPDVIALVGAHYPACRIVCGSAWTYIPESSFDTIYFDIWAHFNEDSNKEATKLHRLYKRWLARDGYMESWTRLATRTGRRV